MKNLLVTIVVYLSCQLGCFTQVDSSDLFNTDVIINRLRVDGNEKTKNRVIFGESKLNIGDTIRVHNLNEEFKLSRRNLYNSGLFNEVDIFIEKWTDNNEIDIVFSVKERWYVYPIPILELTGISLREWKDEHDYKTDRLSYGVTGTHRNLTGNLDKAKIILKTGFQKHIGARYNLTGIDKQRNWGLGFSANHAQNKGLAYKSESNEVKSHIFENDDDDIKFTSASISLIRRKSFNRRHSLSYIFNKIEAPNFVLEELNEDFLPSTSQSINSIAYGFSYENRNLAEYATSGSNYLGGISYNGLYSKDFNTLSINGKYNYYHPISERKFLSLSLGGRYLNDKDLPFYSMLKSAPSKSSLPRGYAKYRILPKSYFTFKTEYRYDFYQDKINDLPLIPSRFEPINFKILPKAFLDFGSTVSNQYVNNNKLNNDFLYSYGIGVDIVTIYNTPIIFEYGRNHLAENSFQFGLGKTF